MNHFPIWFWSLQNDASSIPFSIMKMKLKLSILSNSLNFSSEGKNLHNPDWKKRYECNEKLQQEDAINFSNQLLGLQLQKTSEFSRLKTNSPKSYLTSLWNHWTSDVPSYLFKFEKVAESDESSREAWACAIVLFFLICTPFQEATLLYRD